jgi:hypothetical protein
MLIRYGYELTLNCPRPTTMVCLLDAHRERLRDLRYETRLMTMPEIATSAYLDTFGNTVRRFFAPAINRGRDAADIALATSFGPHTLSKFRVWTEEIDDAVLADLTRRTA